MLRVNETIINLPPAPSVAVHIFLDKTVMEVFVNGGEQAITQVIYPPQEDQHLWLFAQNGTATFSDLQVWRLSALDLL